MSNAVYVNCAGLELWISAKLIELKLLSFGPRINRLRTHFWLMNFAAVRGYLEYLCKAISEGVAVKTYFAWSFMDNFEWREGYSQR